MRDRVAIVLTTAAAALHLAVAGRYDLFRDELYFIVCGRHPALGYADQPPLVPFIAAGAYALGSQTWVVRLAAVAAAAALVWLVIAFVRLLGGGDGAAWIAGLAAAFAPMLMGLTATLNTTTFEPLAWTLVAYGLARAVLLDDRRALIWAGVAAGIAMEAKYALPVWLLSLAIGLTAFEERRVLRYRELWIGLGIAVAIALPSVLWQAVHGWPFAEVVHNAADKDLTVAPLGFLLNQVFVLDPLFAPIWICGLIAPFVRADCRAMRFLTVAWVLTALAIIAGGGKDYYLAPAYPALFAVGGFALERIVRAAWARTAYMTLAVAVALIGAPLALPLLSPQALVAYQQHLHIQADKQEQGDEGELIPPAFADMLGWHEFVREVGYAYASIPPAQRSGTAILVSNYGEAAALDIYGAAYSLPPALSGHNQYFFWGSRGQTPRNILRVQFDPEKLRPYCASVRILGTTHAAYARSFENGRTIAFCRGLHPDISEIWPSLKNFI